MGLLLYGSKGSAVLRLQQALNKEGFDLQADGHFGKKTEDAVMSLQQRYGLLVDGIAGDEVREVLGYYGDTRLHLEESDLIDAATQLDVDLPAVKAVHTIESKGHGFLADGRPVILFERHIMLRRLKEHGVDPEPWLKDDRYTGVVNVRSGGYIGGADEHNRLSAASTIHADAALESCSWGLFQIMGYHWQRLGYDSIHQFVALMAEHERNQLEAFVRFVKHDSAIHRALQRHDWTDFARRYNGSGYAKNRYDTKLAAAWDMHRKGIAGGEQ
ncbi:MAG: N-acetylmuramidase family protein [Marinobacterium sp.]|nr:N-acetylmuramidase family protein [Marinobacterium sp.]